MTYNMAELKTKLNSELPNQVFAYHLIQARDKGLIVKSGTAYKIKLFKKKDFIKFMKRKEEKWLTNPRPLCYNEL